MNEITKIDSEKSIGIKEAVIIRKISPEYFRECGTFSRRDVKKEYKPGKGIVHSIVDTVVYFECLHQATPESLGGVCCRGTVVCKECIVKCAEPKCGRYVCSVASCNCGGMRDGQVYCTRHIHTGIIGLLCNLFD